VVTKRQTLASLSIAMLCLAVATSSARAGDAAMTPVGVWATERAGARVKIEDCGGKLCGTLIWLKEPLDKQGKDKLDSSNPDASLRSRKLIGLALLRDFVPDGAAVWSGGKIYDPDDGKTYSCNLTMQDAKTMRVRGYIGFSLLGKTQIWTRVE
jgi:uncharacterized protein (DUF2147 family)